jgi:hypothetical protein
MEDFRRGREAVCQQVPVAALPPVPAGACLPVPVEGCPLGREEVCPRVREVASPQAQAVGCLLGQAGVIDWAGWWNVDRTYSVLQQYPTVAGVREGAREARGLHQYAAMIRQYLPDI